MFVNLTRRQQHSVCLNGGNIWLNLGRQVMTLVNRLQAEIDFLWKFCWKTLEVSVLAKPI